MCKTWTYSVNLKIFILPSLLCLFVFSLLSVHFSPLHCWLSWKFPTFAFMLSLHTYLLHFLFLLCPRWLSSHRKQPFSFCNSHHRSLKQFPPLYCSMKLGRLCSSLKLGNRWVISLPVGFCCRLNCVFVPINLIKSLIAFANHPASSCCCLLLPLISEITGPLLEHKATDNSNACGRVGGGGL